MYRRLLHESIDQHLTEQTLFFLDPWMWLLLCWHFLVGDNSTWVHCCCCCYNINHPASTVSLSLFVSHQQQPNFRHIFIQSSVGPVINITWVCVIDSLKQDDSVIDGDHFRLFLASLLWRFVSIDVQPRTIYTSLPPTSYCSVGVLMKTEQLSDDMGAVWAKRSSNTSSSLHPCNVLGHHQTALGLKY